MKGLTWQAWYSDASKRVGSWWEAWIKGKRKPTKQAVGTWDAGHEFTSWEYFSQWHISNDVNPKVHHLRKKGTWVTSPNRLAIWLVQIQMHSECLTILNVSIPSSCFRRQPHPANTAVPGTLQFSRGTSEKENFPSQRPKICIGSCLQRPQQISATIRYHKLVKNVPIGHHWVATGCDQCVENAQNSFIFIHLLQATCLRQF